MKDMNQTLNYSNHPSSNLETKFNISGGTAKDCPFHTKYFSCNSYVQNNSKRHIETQSQGISRHWNIVQNKLCYNSRPFRKMPQHVLTSYCELLNVFELNWTIVEPLYVHPYADFISSTKLMTTQKSSYLSSVPLCSVNISEDGSLSKEVMPSSQEDAPSLTCTCSLSCASSEESLKDNCENYVTNTSPTFESKVVSNVSNQIQEDTSLCFLESKLKMTKDFCHYIVFPFELTSQQCIIEFPESCLESSLKVLSPKLTSNSDQDTYLKCDSTKNNEALNLFESKFNKPDVSLVLKPQAPLPPLGSKNIISSKKSCTAGITIPGRSTDLNEYKTGIQIFASRNLTSAEISHYVSQQLEKLKLTGCCYPSNMLVIFLQIPFNVKYYLQQTGYQRSFAPTQLYLKDVKPIPECIRSFSQNKKVTWHNNVFARVFQWKSNKTPTLIRSRSLNAWDLQEKSISLFVFCSGKDMIAFDWLPFLSRLYSFSVREYKYKMRCSEQSHDTITLKLPSYHSRQQTSKNSVQIHSFIDNSHCSLRFASLILEYPGSGQSSGTASIETVLESTANGLAKALQELSNRLGVSHIDIRFIGYSLGSAVALRAAHILSLDIAQCNDTPRTVLRLPFFTNLKNPPDITMSRVILVAPFTSVADWATIYFKIPCVFQPFAKKLVDPLLNIAGMSWNNSESIQHLSLIIKQYGDLITVSDIHKFPCFQIHIFHGNKDSMVPFHMGKELATLSKRIFETDSKSKQSFYDDATSLFSKCEYKTSPSVLSQRCMSICEPVPEIRVSPERFDPPSPVKIKPGFLTSLESTYDHIVHFYEMKADHHTIMKDSKTQDAIFNALLSSWCVAFSAEKT